MMPLKRGYKKVVFIIRRDFAEEFKEIFEPKLKGKNRNSLCIPGDG